MTAKATRRNRLARLLLFLGSASGDEPSVTSYEAYTVTIPPAADPWLSWEAGIWRHSKVILLFQTGKAYTKEVALPRRSGSMCENPHQMQQASNEFAD
ncbi:hypothetical protein BB934_16105 [Microvirga ossetica]|uniref:Uncharacterized protein n=1 Tax=Microvirga ossetica TaxID=1882682 RepID=A0A1B2EHW6_9HYPH|nr:hypothetical protein BB934_16105 [Microvirga ossetica]